MARNLLCPGCDKRRKELAVRYNEFYESVEGKSKGEFLCDGCHPANPIHIGDICFASVQFPTKDHPNYKGYKPAAWMNDYLTPLPKYNESEEV